jgi:hypothetical protein
LRGAGDFALRRRERLASMPTSPPSPRDTMLELIAGFRAARAIHAAARLKLADALREGPLHAEAIAKATSTHAPSLERLLCALASLGVVADEGDRRFALTPLGATLDSGAPGSLHAWAEVALGGEHYAAWGELEHGVRHGEVSFEHALGTDVWSYRRDHPEQGALFSRGMAALAGKFDEALLVDPAFARVRCLVDVGGGDGSVLLALLHRHPTVRGVVFDRPHVVGAARARIDEAGLGQRCDVAAGDAFESVPRGDAYLLCRVLHDWDDERARAVIDRCGRAAEPDARLFVIERLLPERFDTSHAARAAAFADLAMMVMTGGRERTSREFGHLLGSAGFRMLRVAPSASGLALVEAEAMKQ